MSGTGSNSRMSVNKGPLRVIAVITLWSFLFTGIGGEYLLEISRAAGTPLGSASTGSNRTGGPGSSLSVESELDEEDLDGGPNVFKLVPMLVAARTKGVPLAVVYKDKEGQGADTIKVFPIDGGKARRLGKNEPIPENADVVEITLEGGTILTCERVGENREEAIRASPAGKVPALEPGAGPGSGQEPSPGFFNPSGPVFVNTIHTYDEVSPWAVRGRDLKGEVEALGLAVPNWLTNEFWRAQPKLSEKNWLDDKYFTNRWFRIVLTGTILGQCLSDEFFDICRRMKPGENAAEVLLSLDTIFFESAPVVKMWYPSLALGEIDINDPIQVHFSLINRDSPFLVSLHKYNLNYQIYHPDGTMLEKILNESGEVQVIIRIFNEKDELLAYLKQAAQPASSPKQEAKTAAEIGTGTNLSAPDEPSDGTKGPLIGKWMLAPGTEIEFTEPTAGNTKGHISFDAYDIETYDRGHPESNKPEHIEINAERAPSGTFENYSEVKWNTPLPSEIDRALAATLGRIPETNRFLLEPNEYGIDGIGLNILAKVKPLEDNALSSFHELYHASSLTAADIIPNITGGEEALDAYIEEQGKEYRQIPEMREHYALRLLQKQNCPEEDRILHARIQLIDYVTDQVQDFFGDGELFKDPQGLQGIDPAAIGILVDMAMDYGETFREEIATKKVDDERKYLTTFMRELLAYTTNPEVLRLIRESATLLLRHRMGPGAFVGFPLLGIVVKTGDDAEGVRRWLAVMNKFVKENPDLINEHMLVEIVAEANSPRELQEILIREYPQSGLAVSSARASLAGERQHRIGQYVIGLLELIKKHEPSINALLGKLDPSGIDFTTLSQISEKLTLLKNTARVFDVLNPDRVYEEHVLTILDGIGNRIAIAGEYIKKLMDGRDEVSKLKNVFAKLFGEVDGGMVILKEVKSRSRGNQEDKGQVSAPGKLAEGYGKWRGTPKDIDRGGVNRTGGRTSAFGPYSPDSADFAAEPPVPGNTLVSLGMTGPKHHDDSLNGGRSENELHSKRKITATSKLLAAFGKEKLKGLNTSQAAKLMGMMHGTNLSRHLHANPADYDRYGIKRPIAIGGIAIRLQSLGKEKLKGLNEVQAAKLMGVSKEGLVRYLGKHPEAYDIYDIINKCAPTTSVLRRGGMPNYDPLAQPDTMGYYARLDDIRKYFLNVFMKTHCPAYKGDYRAIDAFSGYMIGPENGGLDSNKLLGLIEMQLSKYGESPERIVELVKIFEETYERFTESTGGVVSISPAEGGGDDENGRYWPNGVGAAFYKKNPSADGSGKVRDLALAAAQLEKIANIYDNLNLEFFGNRIPIFMDENRFYGPSEPQLIFDAFAYVGLDENDAVIDLGMGDGRWVTIAYSLFAAKSYGVDLTQRALEIAREGSRRLVEQGILAPDDVGKNITFKEGDLFEEDLSDVTVIVHAKGSAVGILTQVENKILKEAQAGTWVILYGDEPDDDFSNLEHVHTVRKLGAFVSVYKVPRRRAGLSASDTDFDNGDNPILFAPKKPQTTSENNVGRPDREMPPAEAAEKLEATTQALLEQRDGVRQFEERDVLAVVVIDDDERLKSIEGVGRVDMTGLNVMAERLLSQHRNSRVVYVKTMEEAMAKMRGEGRTWDNTFFFVESAIRDREEGTYNELTKQAFVWNLNIPDNSLCSVTPLGFLIFSIKFNEFLARVRDGSKGLDMESLAGIILRNIGEDVTPEKVNGVVEGVLRPIVADYSEHKNYQRLLAAYSGRFSWNLPRIAPENWREVDEYFDKLEAVYSAV